MCEQKYIVLHTEYLKEESPEYMDLIFKGVVGHFFENVLEGNIILEIEQNTPDVFYKNNKALLQTYGLYGLPLSTKNVEEFIQDLNRKNLKIFEIYSSYGLSGWIIGTDFELIERSKKQA
jgi:hypothetical protein